MKAPLRIVLTIAAAAVVVLAGMLLHQYRDQSGAPAGSPQTVQAKIKAQEDEVDRCQAEVKEIAGKYDIIEITPLPEELRPALNPNVCACGPITPEGLRINIEDLEKVLRETELNVQTLAGLQGPKLVTAIKDLGRYHERFWEVDAEAHFQLSVTIQLRANGLKDDHPEIVAAKNSMVEQSEAARRIAESCREDYSSLPESIRQQLKETRQRLADREEQYRVWDRQWSEYAAAKQRHAASLTQLRQLKEQAAQEAPVQAIPPGI